MLKKIKYIYLISKFIIVNYLKTKSKPVFSNEEELLDKDNEDDQAILEFIIDKDGDINLNIHWNNNSDALARNLGSMINHIHNGSFRNHTNVLLLEMINNPNNKYFAEKCIETIYMEQNEDFLIKPSEVFKINHNN